MKGADFDWISLLTQSTQ